MRSRDTIRALAEITDEGLFEEIATAVLREANPLCAALCHPGLNADGMTRKAPLDGIAFVQGARPPHLVAVQHTITAAEGLAKKWLHDPASVTVRKSNRRSSAPAGDLVKTAAVVANERRRSPDLRATLILTTNEEPDEQLVREVTAAGAARDVEVDVWSRRRIAHVLDYHPTGQWIRRKLGIEAERLSAELLAELSRRSLETFPLPDDPGAWVPRALDDTIARLRRLVTFPVAESGLGKSVACYRALRSHIDGGGHGLVLPHEVVESSITLDQALAETLRQLHPQLAHGENPLEHCSTQCPLLVVVEDVNRSGQPQRLVEKLTAWATRSGDQGELVMGPSRLVLVCPIWPRTLELVGDQTRKAMEPMMVFPEPMTVEECRRAVITRATRAGRPVSELTADNIASALGHDPLLIALHDYDTAPDPHEVLGGFIERELMRVQAGSNELAHDLRVALLMVAAQMLHRRRLDPSWREIGGWELPARVVERLARVAHAEKLLRLVGPSSDPRLSFRHDRVRDWLLIESAAELEVGGRLANEIATEPYYAEVLGAVVVRLGAPASLLDRLRCQNPLALFHALRLAPGGMAAVRRLITDKIIAWLAEPATLNPANNHLRWYALAALELTDGAEVPSLVRMFPDQTFHGCLASLHNGDVSAGIELCTTIHFGSGAPFRDQQIAHAKLHFGQRFLGEVAERLHRIDGESARARRGLLELSGHLGDPALVEGLEACWRSDAARDQRLQEYLWAFARCCDEATAARHLAPICDAWAALPDKTEDGSHATPRNEFAAHALKWAFERSPPSVGALIYFAARARDPDLAGPMIYMLNGIDHPIAVTCIAEYAASRIRQAAPGSALAYAWRSNREVRTMSRESREVLLEQWRNPEHDHAQRLAAFRLWSATEGPDDVRILREARHDAALRDNILAQRLIRADKQAVPDLIGRLRDGADRDYWWSHARHAWTPELTIELDLALRSRGEKASRLWHEEFDEDYSMSELLVQLPIPEAERMLLEHWEHLRFSPRFVQVALYLTTPALCRLAAESIAEAPVPARLLAFISHTYGVRSAGHPGVTREAQVSVLEPYIDLLRDGDRSRLADACNQGGWFETRRRLLDKHLTNRYYAWSIANPTQVFDELLPQRSHWIDREIENALRTGTPWQQFLETLLTWQASRRSFEALQVVAFALMAKGTREDIDALNIHEEIDPAAATALIADTTFAIRRRTLR